MLVEHWDDRVHAGEAIQQRRRNGPYRRVITWPAEVQQTKTWDVELVFWRCDYTVNGGFDEACFHHLAW